MSVSGFIVCEKTYAEGVQNTTLNNTRSTLLVENATNVGPFSLALPVNLSLVNAPFTLHACGKGRQRSEYLLEVEEKLCVFRAHTI